MFRIQTLATFDAMCDISLSGIVGDVLLSDGISLSSSARFLILLEFLAPAGYSPVYNIVCNNHIVIYRKKYSSTESGLPSTFWK